MNSYIYEFKDLPSTDIPYNAETFTAMQNKLLDSIFPVGRGFIDFTDTDYSNYLGFTWERELAGLTPIGLDTTQPEFNEISKTGGEKKHQLTIDEMPSHGHNANLSAGIETGISRLITSDWSYNTKNQQNSGLINSSGGGQPHNNLSPYKVVAYWKRVA